jgi:hypothetical protein
MERTCPWKEPVHEMNLSMERTCPWNEPVHGKNLSMERTCTWKEPVHGTNLSMERTCPWNEPVHGKNLSMERTCPWNRMLVTVFYFTLNTDYGKFKRKMMPNMIGLYYRQIVTLFVMFLMVLSSAVTGLTCWHVVST